MVSELLRLHGGLLSNGVLSAHIGTDLYTQWIIYIVTVVTQGYTEQDYSKLVDYGIEIM